MEYKIYKTIEKFHLIKSPGKIVIACSGGPDSMALLNIMNNLKESLGITLHVMHLNHLSRGAEAEKDAEFVKESCRKLALPFTLYTFNVPLYARRQKISFEEAGRKVRLHYYKKALSETGSSVAATAHTLDDHVETILMRILQGTGPSGIRGILPSRRHLISPLINTTKKEIIEYLMENKIDFRVDESNLSATYFRNKIRHILLPLIEKEFNPGIRQSLARMAQWWQEEEEYWDKKVSETSTIVTIAGKSAQIKISGFNSLEIPLKKRLFRHALQAVKGNLEDITFSHLGSLLELAGKESGSKISLPGRISAEVEFDNLVIRRSMTKTKLPDVPLPVPGTVEIPFWNLKIISEIIKYPPMDWTSDSFHAYIDRNTIKGNLTLRARKPGDIIMPLGMGGRKKIKELLMEYRIPASQRESVPIICDEEKILWVAGVRLDERAKVTSKTKEILHLKVDKGE
ncbi:MAG: tRNA lysidine(34) synthetase TilS [Firmicutes bacterium]|nr:tRNA lysidine(34) synthetase TilS [Bacillota bacterium]